VAGLSQTLTLEPDKKKKQNLFCDHVVISLKDLCQWLLGEDDTQRGISLLCHLLKCKSTSFRDPGRLLAEASLPASNILAGQQLLRLPLIPTCQRRRHIFRHYVPGTADDHGLLIARLLQADHVYPAAKKYNQSNHCGGTSETQSVFRRSFSPGKRCCCATITILERCGHAFAFPRPETAPAQEAKRHRFKRRKRRGCCRRHRPRCV